MSAHDENGGIYKVTINHDNGGLAEKIVSNGGSLCKTCNKVHSLTTYNDNSTMTTRLHLVTLETRASRHITLQKSNVLL